MKRGKFIVRLFDMFDGWMDITEPLSHKKAGKILNEKTSNGTHNIKYKDGDYYCIFPENTKMFYTPERLGR